ncbi:MAG: TRAP transporter substrate-binding protein [Bacteroidota bacterium]
MRKAIIFLLLLSVLAGPACQQAEEEAFVFKVSLFVNEQDTWFQAFTYFDTILRERSEGRIRLEIYPSEQLAKEIESIRLIQAGVIDMTVSGSLLSNWIEIATFCELPFFLKNDKEQAEFIQGSVGKEIEQAMLKKMGLRPVTYFIRGPRHLTSNKPIQSPEDLEGLIVRVPNVPSFVTAWAAMGAKPTPMAFSEVFTSLQQGTIDAQENPLSLIYQAGFSEVQQYVNRTEHVMSWSYPIIGEEQFQRLPEELQLIFLEAAEDMQKYERQLFEENESRLEGLLKEKGMTFIEVDKSAFADKCEDAIFENLSVDMQSVYLKVNEEREIPSK